MSVTLVKPDLDQSWTEPESVEKVTAADPRHGIIWANPARVSGTPCFAGTRVPIRNLWDYLEEGPSMDGFLDGFPGVTHEQAKAVLRMACERLLEDLPPDTCHG